MEELKKENEEAFKYLDAVGKNLWTRSHFNIGPKCDLIVNNFCEAWNKYIVQARDKPIITMLEMMRRMLITIFQLKRETMLRKKIDICPKIREKLKEQIELSKNCHANHAGEGNFQVLEKDRQFFVSLSSKFCDCWQWALTAIPCRHDVASIRYLRDEPEKYVDDCYKKEMYMQAYEGIMMPIIDSTAWPNQNLWSILPLHYKRQPGRPPKCRKKALDEPQTKCAVSRVGQTNTCSNCKQSGHNKRSCKNAFVSNKRPPISKGGRPHKKPRTNETQSQSQNQNQNQNQSQNETQGSTLTG